MHYKAHSQKPQNKESWRREFEEEENRLVKLSIVGKGTYGSVFKAHKMKDPHRLYAVKKIDLSMEKEGFPITALREIMLLRQLSHENIIKFLEIRTSKRLLNSQQVERLQAIDAYRHGLLRARPGDSADAESRLQVVGDQVHDVPAALWHGLLALQEHNPPRFEM